MSRSDNEDSPAAEEGEPTGGGDVSNMPPLLTALILRAGREGHTMQHLADVLGVSYARLNQWRRCESHIGNAQRAVHERAAKYLGIPVVLVQALGQSIQLSDLFWPEEESFELRVAVAIQQLFDDPFLGGFIPPALRSAAPPVKMFVLFLYRELNASGASRLEPGTASWLRPVRDVLEGVYHTERKGTA